jgi:anti-sigma-K factor RskA
MTEQAQSAHPEFAEDLALYAVGALDAAAIPALERHVEQCDACRRELADLRGDAALLALSAAGPNPPARSRQRLMQALVEERSAGTPQTFVMRRPWWNFAPVFASLVLAIFGIMLWRENVGLKRNNEDLRAQVAALTADSAKAHEVLALLNAPDTTHVTLVSTQAHPAPQIKTIYQRRTGRLLLIASNLPAAPDHKAYELWFVPMQGEPRAAGMFKPDWRGSAVMIWPWPEVPAGTEAKAFAVTVEPESGSEHATSPIIMMGSGS